MNKDRIQTGAIILVFGIVTLIVTLTSEDLFVQDYSVNTELRDAVKFFGIALILIGGLVSI
ncbi:MAG: hypothetical protein KDD32_11395 [Bacteroidetes bacterium]|nr:hypothetical protein [Bacteroidota bacterium]